MIITQVKYLNISNLNLKIQKAKNNLTEESFYKCIKEFERVSEYNSIMEEFKPKTKKKNHFE